MYLRIKGCFKSAKNYLVRKTQKYVVCELQIQKLPHFRKVHKSKKTEVRTFTGMRNLFVDRPPFASLYRYQFSCPLPWSGVDTM